MTEEPLVETSPTEAVPRTRDWIWGLVVVVGGTVLGVAGTIWVLANVVFGCGCTYPAPGY